jgi:hypothetical protein
MPKLVARTIQEGFLEFTFDATWSQAFKWDEATEYVDGLQTRQGTRAVDIVGVRNADELWLIEIKDLRGHRIEDRNRRTESFDEITRTKVRDTIAGILWAVQRFKPDRCLQLGRVVRARKAAGSGSILVVLWCEGIDEASADAFTAKLKEALRWLDAKVLVTDRRLWPRAPRSIREALTVTSLPGAPPIASK